MPPNVKNSEKFEKNICLNRKIVDKNEKTVDKKEKLTEKNVSKKVIVKKSILSRILNFVFYSSLILSACLAFFVFVPWEEWIFDENEIANYIDLYSEGNGDWVVRQFLATTDQNLTEPIFQEVDCYEKGYKMERAFNASPSSCGVVITDTLMKEKEIKKLRFLAKKITDEIGYQSYANRESINLKWMNLHKLFKMSKEKKDILKNRDYELIKKASEAAKTVVADAFGLPRDQLHFYLVSQFTSYKPVVPYSEFRHVDKVRSGALVVTSILWLSTTDIDFGGGRTEFLIGEPEPFTPLLIEPKVGRFAAWTSGYETPHNVMEVLWGERLALIFAFTVNPKLGYKDLDNLRQYSENAKDIEY